MTVFLIVGLPDAFFDRAMNKIRPSLSGHTIIASPLRRNTSGNYSITDRDCYQGIESAAKLTKGGVQKFSKGFGVILLRRPWETPKHEELFFPFGLTRSVSSAPPPATGRLLNEIANTTVKAIVEACVSLLGPIAAVRNRIETTNGRTRLLLPTKHFRNEAYKGALAQFSAQIAVSSQPKDAARAFDESLSGKILMRRADGHGSYFLDSGNTWFKSPGRAMHGKPWGDIEKTTPDDRGDNERRHVATCHLSGCLRIGSFIDDGFHFDCTAGGGRLVGEFENCHDFSRRYKGRPHLNIYANDFIRE